MVTLKELQSTAQYLSGEWWCPLGISVGTLFNKFARDMDCGIEAPSASSLMTLSCGCGNYAAGKGFCPKEPGQSRGVDLYKVQHSQFPGPAPVLAQFQAEIQSGWRMD